MFRSRVISFLVALVFVLAVAIYVEHPSVNLVDLNSKTLLRGVSDINDEDHKRGSQKSDIVLVEYSNFGCVFCSIMQETFNKLAREDDLLIITRSIYREKDKFYDRAIIAECVAKHLGDKEYFTISDYLYSNQQTIESSDVEGFAIELGLSNQDVEFCKQKDTDIKDKIANQTNEAILLGAKGTPYIVIIYKGRPIGISYANTYDKFLERIQELVNKNI